MKQDFIHSFLQKRNKRAFTLFAFLLFLSLQAFSQVKINPALLDDYKTNGAEVSAMLKTVEVYEFKDSVGDCIVLHNGFRSSRLLDEQKWTASRDTIAPYRVDIVYSKYPLRNGTWYEIYPLLFNRLKVLFGMDPTLNDSSIEFRKIWQTHCENDAQVDGLFHGIVIWYRTIDTCYATEPEVNDTESSFVSDQKTEKDLIRSIDEISNSPMFPDSIRKIIATQPLKTKIVVLQTYLEKEIENEAEVDLKKSTPEQRERYQREVDDFMKKFPVQDQVVQEVFNRHPEWKNVIVVNDWTGSMYGYGAQVLQWHLLNYEKSGIVSLTLFNDGDGKSSNEKKVGETGGIYSEKADNIPKMVKLFQLIMMKGGGGDWQENDIEAILNAMEQYPDYSEIVLIADNYAPVRDIELADRIDKPVKVILCGYRKSVGVNPHLVYLAKKTGGGLYTIESDIENLDVGLGSGGEVTSMLDTRFKLMDKKSFNDYSLLSTKDETVYGMDYARKNKKKVNKLTVASQNLTEIPRKVYKMKRLNYLDASNNSITKLSSKISKLPYLQTLNLSHNKLSKLPSSLGDVKYIEVLDISYNEYTKLPAVVTGMKFLKNLDASDNQLESLTGDIAWSRLVTLDLSNNRLTALPKSFSKLRKLKSISLAKNELTAIPDGFGLMSKLESADFSDNNLTQLPANLKKLRKLKTLNLSGNNFPEEEKNRIRAAMPGVKIVF